MTEYEQNNLQPEATGSAPVPADPTPKESPEEISAPSTSEVPAVTPEAPVVPTPEIPQAPAVEIPVQTEVATPEVIAAPVAPEAPEVAAPNVGIPVPHLTLEGIPMEEVPQASVSTENWNIPQPPHAPDPQEAIHAAQTQFNPPPAPNPYAQANPQQEAPHYAAPPQYSYGTPPQQPYGTVPPQYQEGQYQQQSYYPPQPPQPTHYTVPPMGYQQKSRLAAGLLGIMFGTFGVHNFYLGFQTKAIIQLVVALAGGLITCGVATVAMAIWGLIEGIQILSSHPSKLYDGNNVILRD